MNILCVVEVDIHSCVEDDKHQESGGIERGRLNEDFHRGIVGTNFLTTDSPRCPLDEDNP